jgi:hypothetical protein
MLTIVHFHFCVLLCPVPEFIDPVFAKTSLKRSITENERFGLVFVKTGSINSGTDIEFMCEIVGGNLIFFSVVL